MRILMLSQGRTVDDQPSFHHAFQHAESEGRRIEFRNIPYLGFAAEHGNAALWAEILRVNREFEPDVVFFQFFQHECLCGDIEGSDPTACILQLKAAENHPLIFGSQGDPFQPNRFRPWVRLPTRPMMAVVRNADAFFSTSMGTLADYWVRQGGRNVIFLPHAYANQNFDCMIEDRRGCEYDAVMVCSIGLSRVRPLGSAIQVAKRWSDATALWRRYGKRFAVFGRGWQRHPAYKGVLSFRDQVAIYKSSRICVDACAPVSEMYYASDRPFFVAGSGSFLVQRYTPRFETMFQAGRHIEFATSTREVVSACDRLLNLEDNDADVRRTATLDLVRAHHCVAHRVDTIISVAEALRSCRGKGLSAEEAQREIRLWHFLPEIDIEKERQYAVRNWVG